MRALTINDVQLNRSWGFFTTFSEGTVMVMFFGRLRFYFPYLTQFLLTTLACFQTSDDGSICQLNYFSLFPVILPNFDPTSRNPV